MQMDKLGLLTVIIDIFVRKSYRVSILQLEGRNLVIPQSNSGLASMSGELPFLFV